MPTDHVKYVLPEYLTGRIDEASRRMVEEHLRGCRMCSLELDELRATFRVIADDGAAKPSREYFKSILPRLRQRLEGTSRRESFWQPILVRLVLPVAAMTVGLALVFQTSFFRGGDEHGGSAEASFLENYTDQDLMIAYLDQGHVQPLLINAPSQSLKELISDRTIASRIVDRLLGSEEIIAQGASVVPTSVLIADLSERDVDILLKRLGERSIL